MHRAMQCLPCGRSQIDNLTDFLGGKARSSRNPLLTSDREIDKVAEKLGNCPLCLRRRGHRCRRMAVIVVAGSHTKCLREVLGPWLISPSFFLYFSQLWLDVPRQSLTCE